ncbi:hypothetical protein HaLaN_28613, partial [Haematococcus lacustris]
MLKELEEVHLLGILIPYILTPHGGQFSCRLVSGHP